MDTRDPSGLVPLPNGTSGIYLEKQVTLFEQFGCILRAHLFGRHKCTPAPTARSRQDAGGVPQWENRRQRSDLCAKHAAQTYSPLGPAPLLGHALLKAEGGTPRPSCHNIDIASCALSEEQNSHPLPLCHSNIHSRIIKN